MSSASRTYNASASSANFGYYGGYALTDWKVSPELTLNLGLRYEVPIPRSTSPNAFTSFDPELINPASGLKGALAYLGDCQGCVTRNRFGKIDYSSIGPRLGAAWSVNEKTVVRLGYGMHYAAGNGLTGGFCIRCQNGYSTAAGLGAPDAFTPALRWDAVLFLLRRFRHRPSLVHRPATRLTTSGTFRQILAWHHDFKTGA